MHVLAGGESSQAGIVDPAVVRGLVLQLRITATYCGTRLLAWCARGARLRRDDRPGGLSYSEYVTWPISLRACVLPHRRQ